jgi:hypothetical protein
MRKADFWRAGCSESCKSGSEERVGKHAKVMRPALILQVERSSQAFNRLNPLCHAKNKALTTP